MNTQELLQLRLNNQHISAQPFTAAHKLLAHLGVLQAQDYASSKWSLGLRLAGTTDADVEAVIEKKKIIRTWLMRGTLHYAAPADVSWIRALVAPRLIASYAGTYKKLELTESVFTKSERVISAALNGGNRLTRAELQSLLEKSKISTQGLRWNHLLLRASLDGLICYGPRSNKDFTLVLQDEWIGTAKPLPREEALKRIAGLFFQGHAPATLKDFAGWVGITLIEAKAAIEMNGNGIVKETVDGQEHFTLKQQPGGSSGFVHLLPSFDEYLMGYKDRAAMMSREFQRKVVGEGNGLYSPVMLVDGRVEGTWKRTVKKNEVVVEVFPFRRLNRAEEQELEAAIGNYGRFIQLPVVRM